MSDSFQFFGPDGPIDPKEFFSKMKKESKWDKTIHDCGVKSASAGFSDVAESMHIIMDDINRSSDLNVGAMIILSKTFDAVFQAFVHEADANILDNDGARKFISECGVVDAGDGCPDCGSGKSGGIHLHDLQVVAGMAAMRFFMFSRLRKINNCLPLVRRILEDGDPAHAAQVLRETVKSATGMLDNLRKMGLGLIDDHPVAINAKDGMEAAAKLMAEIAAVAKARADKSKEKED